ncbi:MAG: glycosyltransferase involved in cell wall biosynthesis [Gammaproteobacteria bacterium]|jgi:glycosyltransferase involved in cell wall biosynthesis
MNNSKNMTVIQTLPALDAGGVERGTIEIAKALVTRGHRSIVVSAGGRMLEELNSIGSEHITLPIGEKSPMTLKHIPQLRKLLKDSNALILHARSRFPAWISYLAMTGLERNLRPYFITSVHGPYSVNQYSKIMMRGEKIIAVSNFIKNYICENYPDTAPEKIIMIPRGVCTKDFPYGHRPNGIWTSNWNSEYPQTTGKVLITLPARTTRWKGHEEFLELFKLLRSNKDIHGIIVGGPHPGKEAYYRELKEKVLDLGMQHTITFTGHRNDIREIMSISSIVLSLSTKPEAFGRTILESLSLGVPVISYDHGGAREIMRSIFPAGLVPDKNNKIAIEKIRSFIKTPPTVPETNPFTLERMQNETMALYESLAFDSKIK